MKPATERKSESAKKHAGSAPRRKRTAKEKREAALGLKVVDIERLKRSHAEALAGKGRYLDEILADVATSHDADRRGRSVLPKS